MDLSLHPLAGIAPYLAFGGLLLMLISIVYEKATVYEWDPVAFEFGCVVLRTEAPCVYEVGYESTVCDSLVSFFDRDDIPAEAYAKNPAVVLIRTKRYLRYGFLRGKIEFGGDKARICFYFSSVSFFGYLMMFGCAIGGLFDVGAAICFAGAIVFVYFDQRIIRQRAASISNFLLTKFEIKEGFE